MAMCVSTARGDMICEGKAEVIEMIKQGAALPEGDELWVSGQDMAYPCLSILVKGQYACVHYFKNDEGAVWQSCGDFHEGVVFLAGSEEWTAPEYVIIPFEKAVVCLEEFWDTLKRPQCIEWDRLWEEA